MVGWLDRAELTESGRPILTIGEYEHMLISLVDIEPDLETHPNLPPYKSGVLTLTTHRLIWTPQIDAINKNTCSAAVQIPLSLITHIYQTKKKSLKSILNISSPRMRFEVGGKKGGGVMGVTVVVRERGESKWEGFYGKVWEAWRARVWEEGERGGGGGVGGGESSGGGGESVAIRVPVVGLAGILRKEQEMWESTDKSLQDAFQDLNALMSKAKEMVMLAEKMRQKLLAGPSSQSSTAGEGEMSSKEEMQDWLLSVGIISPVTKESAGALYHQQLSRQLADFVKIPLERAGGMLNLIDIYCLFNRACGTELISPDDLLQACCVWEKLDVPVMLRKFDSGVMVVQSKSYSDDEVFGRIRALVTKPEALQTGVSASDAAMTLGVAPAMAKEHLLAAESKGLICRDTSPDGLRFFVNLFSEITLDDIYLVKDHGIYATWVSVTSV